MKDGIIKGSGNSRYLRTVANALTLYPNYESFIAALIQGTFPIDLNGINSSGWSAVGTKLNKAALLTDSLCSALGLSTAATPNQAMDKLRQLINTANSNADGRTKMQLVSYTGTNTYGESNPCSITFPFAPKLVTFLGLGSTSGLGSVVQPYDSGNYTSALVFFLLPSMLTTDYREGSWLGTMSFEKSVAGNRYQKIYAKKSSDGKEILWYNEGGSRHQLNAVGIYNFLGIG